MSPRDDIIVGIGGYLGHDSNAALLVGGRLVASAQEERYTRHKHDGHFPERAIRDCLAIGGVRPAEVGCVAFAEKPVQTALFSFTGHPGNLVTRALGRLLPERFAGLFTVPARTMFPRARFSYAWHHVSHVAAAFYSSGFERAAFLCVDGMGEDYCATIGVIDHAALSIRWELPYENGLGRLYKVVTDFLGFHSLGSEYKVMGLAPYGRPVYADALGRIVFTDENGSLRLRAPIRFHHESELSALPSITAATGVKPREPHEPVTTAHVDIAASLQKLFDDEIVKMARFTRTDTGEDSVLFCGGCAQNCVAAGRLRAAGIFRRVFNSPVGGDMGCGLGAALMQARMQQPARKLSFDFRGYYLGGEPGPAPASAASWRMDFAGPLHEFVASQIAAGRTVGWVRGRMELGARALGARSILADPRQPGMQSRLNLAVKFRESFRPFAPAILAEHVGEWFDSSEESDYMNYTANLLPARRRAVPEAFASLKERLDFSRSEIQSVIHVDFSARLQTVRREVHPDFHRLISAFHAQTGVPIVINTSFNVSGQPIVRTAAEAWECFLNTDLDLLVLNDEVYRNPGQRTRAEKLAWLKQFASLA
ncbi:MAG TPA: carbamoyltransferase C-terminal domain-containing protein [Opitutus sp.]|nr:carbamoyltransferase C-terminal domain-containing protein [Opitutus sp.]